MHTRKNRHKGEGMKKLFNRLCCAVCLSFFMLLPLVLQSASAAVQDTQRNPATDTPLLAQETGKQTAPVPAGEQPGTEKSARSEQKSTKHPILFYIPNRIFDLLDIVRLRVRVGPGISAGVRATKPVSAFVGFHSAIFAGLPGPRGKAEIPLPVGLEMRGGVQASVADAAPGNIYYGPLEVGAEVQPLIVGINIGIEPFEILDFVAGFFFIDLQDDDF